ARGVAARRGSRRFAPRRCPCTGRCRARWCRAGTRCRGHNRSWGRPAGRGSYHTPASPARAAPACRAPGRPAHSACSRRRESARDRARARDSRSSAARRFRCPRCRRSESAAKPPVRRLCTPAVESLPARALERRNPLQTGLLMPIALDRYDTRTIILHWITAILVVVLWSSAQVIDWFPQGPARTNMRSVHVALGVLLAIVLVQRIAWRQLAGAQLPAIGHPTLARVAGVVHGVLYLLLVGEVLLGFTNVW